MAEEQNTDFKYNEVYIQGYDDWDEPFQNRDLNGCLLPFLFLIVMIILLIYGTYVVIQR